MVDWLLLEHDALLGFVAQLDVESLHEATKGKGTDDTALIRALCTRNKRCLAAINMGYRQAYDESLQSLIESELKGWCVLLLCFFCCFFFSGLSLFHSHALVSVAVSSYLASPHLSLPSSSSTRLLSQVSVPRKVPRGAGGAGRSHDP